MIHKTISAANELRSFRVVHLQEFFLIVGVGLRKLGPRSLSATPEYVILAGICFPRSEACATFGLLAQELERVEPPSRAWCVRTVFGLEAL
jgi:hypothetical protein